MKYVVVLGDGMADRPIAELGDQTPLAYAETPTMDQLAAVSEIGMVHTIPDGMKPGSDTSPYWATIREFIIPVVLRWRHSALVWI